MTSSAWRSYEEVAAYLVGQFKEHFGLEKVEGGQKVKGERSGTEWRLDAKGVRLGGEGFVIVESRRHMTAGQKQEDLAALAYRIMDTGAAGGIIVSPLPIQEGAKKIAGAEGIIEVTLNAECTNSDYVMAFLKRIMIGVTERIKVMDDYVAVVISPARTESSDQPTD